MNLFQKIFVADKKKQKQEEPVTQLVSNEDQNIVIENDYLLSCT